MLKRQRLQAEAMSALDAKTNEMLIRNAQNTAEQAKMTARLASGSSIKISGEIPTPFMLLPLGV